MYLKFDSKEGNNLSRNYFEGDGTLTMQKVQSFEYILFQRLTLFFFYLDHLLLINFKLIQYDPLWWTVK